MVGDTLFLRASGFDCVTALNAPVFFPGTVFFPGIARFRDRALSLSPLFPPLIFRSPTVNNYRTKTRPQACLQARVHGSILGK